MRCLSNLWRDLTFCAVAWHHGQPLHWLLNSRVKWNDKLRPIYCSMFDITFGVRHGSVLSFVLFVLCVNDFANITAWFIGYVLILYHQQVYVKLHMTTNINNVKLYSIQFGCNYRNARKNILCNLKWLYYSTECIILCRIVCRVSCH